MKNLLLKKHLGNFGDILGSMVCIIMMLALLTSCINVVTVLSKKTELNRISRKALLQLEIQGELQSEQINELKKSIEEVNLKDVHIVINNGGPKASYGNEVSIKISATATGSDLGLFKSLNVWNRTFDFSTKYISTSKAPR